MNYSSRDMEEVLAFVLKPEFRGMEATGRKLCPFPDCTFSTGDMADLRLHVEAEAREHRTGVVEWFENNFAAIETALRKECPRSFEGHLLTARPTREDALHSFSSLPGNRENEEEVTE